MTKRRVLVVEDDAAIRRGIVDALQFEGYHAVEAPDGDEGLARALNGGFDLLLLDLVLPGCSGLDILREVREHSSTTPVVILTARGDETDRVRGLKMGADDYVVKPFSVAELLARVEAVLRRSPERPNDVSQLELPQGTVNLDRREGTFRDGERFSLSEREVELLRYLAGHAGRAISRDEILARVWNIDPRGLSSRTIDMHVARLREKLRDDPARPEIILTVRGQGYMFAAMEKAR
ncbi:MAG: response regulator transcription factor [Planctomycetaceae bacterium]